MQSFEFKLVLISGLRAFQFKIRIMKYLFFIIIAGYVFFFVNPERNNNKFLPNLPIGEFKVVYKGIIQCDSKSNSNIQYNLYLSKKSVNETEIRGNLTLKVPLDDSFDVNVNLAVKDSIGGWKNNAHIIFLPKACSALRSLYGIKWSSFINSFGIKDSNCPIAPGVYVSKGWPLSNSADSNYLGNVFFYGTYKCRLYFTDHQKNQYGCSNTVVEIKRPWEME